MSKCFLLGHKGFIGSHLLPKLKEANYDVVTDMRYFDDKYDVIINLAAVTHTRNEFDPKMFESNIVLVDKIFKRSERIIYASSCSAKYFTNPYAGSKLWAEYLGNKHGNALGLRLHNVYGLGNNKGIVKYLMDQKDGAKITIRGENLIRDYIAVRNVVDYIVVYIEEYERATENGKYATPKRLRGVVDVGTGIGTSTKSLVELYMKLSGKRFEIETIPPDASEPLSMISNNPIDGAISLEDGLTKMGVCTWEHQPVLSDIYNHIKNNK